jgi:class 3 adenylate cyclase/tetratricopeptide (TPR) repeat protein
VARTGVFDPYVPRIAFEWDEHAPGRRWRAVDGSLVFVDISGFTSLTEKLARKGRIGAEELTSVLSSVFSDMLSVAYQRGGSLLKFGGDALLLLFEGPDHPLEAVGAAVDMRAALRASAKIPTSVGRIALRMSVGVHSGSIDVFMVGDSHRELVVTGPTATTTTEMESIADANEIVVSAATRAALPADYTKNAKGNGWVVRKRSVPRSVPRSTHQPVNRPPIPDEEMERFVPVALRSVLSSGLHESEHRTATVGFLVYKGVDALISSEGPEVVGEVLEELMGIVQREADSEGVTFLAGDIYADGGKILLVTGVPYAQEDDEGRMLRMARRILDVGSKLVLHFGANRGHAYSGDVGTTFRSAYTIEGDDVNLAARLMAATGPNQLYASPGVVDRSTTLFRVEAVPPFFVKGKSHPIPAFEVFEEIGTRPPESRHELPFRGRDEEMDLVLGAMESVEAGSGRVFTVLGDTGMGKTRLLQELHSGLTADEWFNVRGEPHGKSSAYYALRDPLRSLLGIERSSQAQMRTALKVSLEERTPDLVSRAPLIADVAHIQMEDTTETAEIEPRFRPDRTADTIVELFRVAFDGVAVLAFDDAQWLDEASLGLLGRLATAAERQKWMVLATSRADTVAFEPIGTGVSLVPLDPGDIREIVLTSTVSTPLRPAEVDDVVNRVGGNPLFLSEIIKVVRETGQATELPDSLNSVVSSQIDRLAPLTREVMRYMSVLGRSFRRIVAAELLAPEGMELDEATRRDLARFIEPEGEDRLRFRHTVVYEASYEGLSYRRRRELHARAGDVIERLAGDDLEGAAGFLATHFLQGGEYDKAWQYAVMAGDRFRSQYAMNEAAAQYRLAVEAARRVPSVDRSERARIFEALGDVCEVMGRYEEANRSFGEARKLVDGDLERRGRLMAKQGLIREKAGELPTALRWFRRGLNPFDEYPGPSEARAELLLAYGGIRFRQGRFRAAGDWCRRALEDPGATDKQKAHALHLLVTVDAHLGLPEAIQVGEQAIEIYERIGDLVGLGDVLNNLGVDAYYRGRWDEATDYHTRAGEVRSRAGHVIGAAASVNNLAEIYCDQGKLVEAEEMFRQALYVFESSNFPVGIALASANLGRTLTRMGRFEEASTHLERGRDMFVEMGAKAFIFETDVKVVEHRLFKGQRAEAESLASQVLHEMQRDESTLMARTALQRVLACCAAAEGRREDAEAHFLISLELAEQANALFEQALTYEGMARVLRSHEEAGEWLEYEADLFEQLGVIATPLIPLT